MVVALIGSPEADAAETWNQVANAPCLVDLDIGSSTQTGPELWGLDCDTDWLGNHAIWHRPGGVETAWRMEIGAANHIAAGPQIAVALNTFEDQVWMWNGVDNWDPVPMAGGPTCMRRIATDTAGYFWVRDCDPAPQLWCYGPGLGGTAAWSVPPNQFSGPGIEVYVEIAPPIGNQRLGKPWIVNFVSPGTFQVYKQLDTTWSIVGTGLPPRCVESLGLSSIGSYVDAWVTDCTPSGNGFTVMHLGPENAPLWSVVDSPGMSRIKVDRTYATPYAIDNSGVLWSYCDVRWSICG
jgi:hypothetical protein